MKKSEDHSTLKNNLSSVISVLARIRSTDLKSNHGSLVQFCNIDGVDVSLLILKKNMLGNNFFLVKEMLLDSGFVIDGSNQAWEELKDDLNKKTLSAPSAVGVTTFGWHEGSYVCERWSKHSVGEDVYYIGDSKGNESLGVSKGSLDEWIEKIGRYCRGNPLLIFSLGSALAGPLLYLCGIENGGIHIVGNSSQGKTSCLRVAASVYGPKNFMRSWASTANGLASVAVEHNDSALLLDEVGLAHAEDVGSCIYQIINGHSKLRAQKTGDLAPTQSWRLIMLSTGEKTITEVLASAGKDLEAGQAVRLIELPLNGVYGAFDELHSFSSASDFSDYLNRH